MVHLELPRLELPSKRRLDPVKMWREQLVAGLDNGGLGSVDVVELCVGKCNLWWTPD